MTKAEQRYKSWVTHPRLDEATRQELLAIKSQTGEIEERFYQELQFGTAGLRGILGAGSNRMNDYTVARAAAGFAEYICRQGEAMKNRGVAISFDSRHRSTEFAQLSAHILASRGVRVLLSDELRPVPFLSFAVRHFHCAGGIMITASHNPREYNGFKVYGEDGGQLNPEAAAAVAEIMDSIEDPISLLQDAKDAKLKAPIEAMGENLDSAYEEMVLGLSLCEDAVRRHSDLKIIYTPLHGAGNKPVRRTLSAVGFKQVMVVPEQEKPDGDFPTAPYPNPEFREALQMGIELAEKEKADLLIATDPDADRTGVAVRSASGDFVVLSGNEIGCLLMDFVLSAKKAEGGIPENAFCVTSVVSSRLPLAICEHYGVKVYQVLTGFKFIAEKIREYEEEGDGHFLFAYEESFGYLAGHDVRDKDAVVSSMLIAEMAADSADRGETLYERLQHLFSRYGYAAEHTLSFVREGISGQERIASVMAEIRSQMQDYFPELEIRRILDFSIPAAYDLASGEKTAIPYTNSNVLVFELDGLDWFACRPSGTEPKLKVYLGAYRDSKEKAEEALEKLKAAAAKPIEAALNRE